MPYLKLFGCLLGLTVYAAAETPVTLNFTVNAVLTGGNGFALSGTGSLTGLGSATISGAGLIDNSLLSGQTSGPIPGSFTLIFPDGALLFGTFDVPSGIVIPQVGGGSSSATGSFTITGGAGRLEGARGSFPSVTGSGVATGPASSTFSVSGQGTLNYGKQVLPQFVFGGGWYTALYFSNTTNAAVSFPVQFIADNGTPLNVPGVGGSSTTVNLPAGGSERLQAPNAGDLVQGYVSTELPNGVIAYGIFRQSVNGIADQEAVVPLVNIGSKSASLAFDDTNYSTAVAIVNPSDAATIATITAKGANGGSLGSATVSVAAKSKVALLLRNLAGLSGIANNRGSIDISVTTGSVAALGLRFYGSAFTSIPAAAR